MPYKNPEDKRRRQAEYVRKRREDPVIRERQNAIQRAWKRKNYDHTKKKNDHLRSLYGIGIDDYDQLFETQGGVCAICKTKRGKRRLSVDHNHKTGKIRGLLCNYCNFALGGFDDSPLILQSAIEYLGDGQ